MKIITDFDGTLTTIEHEYASEMRILMPQLLALCNHDEDLLNTILKEVGEKITANPQNYGWMNRERITAFSDEDLFMQISSRTKLIDEWANEGKGSVTKIAANLKAFGKTLSALTNEAFLQMSAEPVTEKNAPEAESMAVINQLLDRGDEVVIVSNSYASRIIDKLAHFGIKVADAATDPTAQFRVRGNAMKYGLDESSHKVAFATRPVDVNRSGYINVILEERPDVIIGDVLSLDLATPYYLARDHQEIAGIQLYLRLRPYTPKWAIQCATNRPFNSPAKLKTLSHFKELL